MFKNQTRRKGNVAFRSTYTPERFSSGNKNYFIPINRISSNVVEYTNTIETVPPINIGTEADCSLILNEYNLIKSELNDLKTLFSNSSTEISTVLSGLQ